MTLGVRLLRPDGPAAGDCARDAAHPAALFLDEPTVGHRPMLDDAFLHNSGRQIRDVPAGCALPMRARARAARR
jgi:hypothetical protein